VTSRLVQSEPLEYLGVKLTRITVAGLIEETRTALDRRQAVTASYYGFHTANLIAANPATEVTFSELDIVMADGIAVLWTSRFFGRPLDISNRINGDISGPFLCAEAVKAGWSIYLLGGAPGVASAAARRLEAAFPGLRIAGTHHGYLSSDEENDALVAAINRSSATIVLIGMGQPTQEEWIVANRKRVQAALLLGVGAYLDHLVRRVDCYPAWVYAARLNWAYRLVMEPRRLWKRYTVGVPRFCWRLGRTKLQRLRGK
jgi:N-acetylglucosaminyldiphosphoundecaprenol N-acetyl-beta-D-mannosaminyltransferase